MRHVSPYGQPRSPLTPLVQTVRRVRDEMEVENNENEHTFSHASGPVLVQSGPGHNSEAFLRPLWEMETLRPRAVEGTPVAPGWRGVTGNVFASQNGQMHVCDFNCGLRYFNTELGYFVCRVSGRPSRVFADVKNKRNGETSVEATHAFDHDAHHVVGRHRKKLSM